MRRGILLFAVIGMVTACAMQKKLEGLKSVTSTIEPVVEVELPDIDTCQLKKDSLIVYDADGREMLLLRTTVDENGNATATDVINAATVTARFRNVAERFGKVDISFDVTVPKEMQDSKWQLRFYPDLFVMEDSTRLESILITGKDYRKAQLRGYQQYERFLASIITDSSRFYYEHLLETFIERNLPSIYKFKTDSSFVSDSSFYSYYGVNASQAIEHYCKKMLLRRNNKKIANKDKKFRRFVKVPIESQKLRLDTIINGEGSDLIYRYTQTINTRPGLKKAQVSLWGEIYESDKKIFRIPECERITFYISSISGLAEEQDRYIKKVIERRVTSKSAYKISFRKASTSIDSSYANNSNALKEARDQISHILNGEFITDSISVWAACSPEGALKLNDALAKGRAESLKKYLSSSLDSVRFISGGIAENWEALKTLIENDSLVSQKSKERFSKLYEEKDLDRREKLMQKEAFYSYMKEELYPHLRTVELEFHMHRKDMAKDTVITSIPDSNYRKGIEALKNMDYGLAVEILRPYADYNTAVAYCASGMNASAEAILKEITDNPKALYMLAIIYSRKGDYEKALQAYMDACNADSRYISRGNLDPEISELIRIYNINFYK